MKKFLPILITLCILIGCISFVLINVVENASDKPTDGIDHTVGGNTSLKNWHWHIDTPDFSRIVDGIGNGIQTVTTNAGDSAKKLADTVSNNGGKDAVEVADDIVDKDIKPPNSEEIGVETE